MVSRSTIDEERFLVRTARAHLGPRESLEDVLAFCARESVALAIVRCDTSDYPAVHAIETAGGKLGDTLIYYACDLGAVDPAANAERSPSIRPATSSDAASVEAIAREAFRGYLGHYHTDPRLEKSKADDGYADWARRSCESGELAHHVLVAEGPEGLTGFLTLKRNSSDEVEIVLNAVSPRAQGGGIYASLLREAKRWARLSGASRLLVSTQINNVPPQKSWVRAGFEPVRSVYTFHLWLDERG